MVTKDGTEREVDVIVVATGFHVTDSPMFETIIGTQGRSLAQAWEHTGMQAYKGTFVHGFPNMLLMVGPSTGLGHTSIVYMIESQLNYLVSYFKQVRDQGITRTEVKADAQDEFNNSVQHGLRNSVWAHRRLRLLLPGPERQHHHAVAGIHVQLPPNHQGIRHRRVRRRARRRHRLGLTPHNDRGAQDERFSGQSRRGHRGGSGIGRELAVKLAQKGAKVAISDVDAAGLATTERLVREAVRRRSYADPECC